MSRPPCVYVVDDVEEVRESLVYLLRSVGFVVEAYAGAEEFLAAFDDGRPACLVLDVRMPGMSGPDLQAKLKQLGARLPIIFLTAHGDIPMAVRAMQNGAVHFLQKPPPQHLLVEQIRESLAADQAARRAAAQGADVEQRLAALTKRQRQVLELMLKGFSNKTISGQLGVGEKTIEFHRSRILNRMGAENLAHLMRMIFDRPEPRPKVPSRAVVQ